jgi:hypothetical protein
MGEEVTVKVTVGPERAPVANLAIAVVLPGEVRGVSGRTSAQGEFRCRPEAVGLHRFEAVIDGVRSLAPFSVVADRPRWPLAIGAVPLGLALLFVYGRLMVRRWRASGIRRAG